MNEKTQQLEFPIEEIPNQDVLYYRIHTVNIDHEEPDPFKKIKLIAFDPHPKGSTQMSTNWNKYSTPSELQQLAKFLKRTQLSLLLSQTLEKHPIHCKSSTTQYSPNILKTKHTLSF